MAIINNRKLTSRLITNALLLTAFMIPSSAWCYMIEVAGVDNAAVTNNTNVTRSYTSDRYTGFGVGLLVEGKPFGDSSMFGSSSSMDGLYTELGLLYYPRMVGYGTSGTQSSNWLVLPLVEKYYFWNLSIGGGVYVAHAVGSIHSTSVAGTTGAFTFADGNLTTLDYGWTANLGYSFSFWNLFTDLRYDVGLNNLTKTTGDTYKFSEYQLLVGVRF